MCVLAERNGLQRQWFAATKMQLSLAFKDTNVEDTQGALQCEQDLEYSGQAECTLHLIGKLSQESWRRVRHGRSIVQVWRHTGPCSSGVP